MSYVGDFTPGKTVAVKFNTHTTDGTPITLGGTPAISVYKNGSTIESTAGVTLTVDYDSKTGLHNVSVDTSADGTFYSANSDFDIIITTGTVNDVSVVGTKIGQFSLSNRSALRPTTADQTLAVDGSGRVTVGSNADKTGYSLTQTFPANFSSLGINASGHISRVTTVDTVTNGVIVTTNNDKTGYSLTQTFPANFSSLGINASGHISRVVLTDRVTTVDTVTNGVIVTTNNDKTGYSLVQMFPANFASLGINASGHISRVVLTDTVTSLTNGVIVTTNNDKTGYALTSGERTAIANEVETQIIDETDSEKVLEAITNKIAEANPSLGDLTLSAIAAAVRDVSISTTVAGSLGEAIKESFDRMPASGTIVTTGDLPTDYARNNVSPSWYTAPSNSDVSAIKEVTDKLNTLVEIDGLVYRLTENSLELAPTGNAPTVQEITDGVLDELLSAHTISGSVAAGISNAGAAGNPWDSTLEPGLTFGDFFKLLSAFFFGKTYGGGSTSLRFRDINNTTNRILMTVDAQANRLTVTLNTT